jgi:dipeptidyl aminopeptidase/acylaminoacyl peptidase
MMLDRRIFVRMFKRTFVTLFGIVFLSVGTPGIVLGAEGKALTFEDVMRFRQVNDPVISADGEWIAFEARPDRGDGEVILRGVSSGDAIQVSRGRKPVFSKDSKWLAMRLEPSFREKEEKKAEKSKKKDPVNPGMALVEVSTGQVLTLEKVNSFQFSDDSKWIVYQKSKEKKPEQDGETKKDEEKEGEKKENKKLREGRPLIIRRLDDASETRIENVDVFGTGRDSTDLFYAVASQQGDENGLFRRSLARTLGDQVPVSVTPNGRYSSLAWSEEGKRLAFLGAVDDDKGKAGPGSLYVWQSSELHEAVPADSVRQGWVIPVQNRLTWTKDGNRLFFGIQPEKPKEEKNDSEAEEEETSTPNPYDSEALLEKREVDVWHWNDDHINPQQKKMWKQKQDKTFSAVYHLKSDRFVQLGDRAVPRITVSENTRSVIGASDVLYRRETTWDETFRDLYVVDVETGDRQPIAKRLPLSRGLVSMSPDGRFAVYYADRNWHLFDRDSGTSKNLTGKLGVPMWNEDHDYPSTVPGYGLGGWVSGEQAVLIYDKYDIWEIPTSGGSAKILTDGLGRREKTVFRVIRTDPDEPYFQTGQKLLLSGYRDLKKNHGFFEVTEGEVGVRTLLEEEKRFRFLSKAKDSDVFMYTRESYVEFPDIWVASSDFEEPKRVSDVNPQKNDFAWGSAELVEWSSWDGKPLQGVLIKPGNYEPGKRYPVIVYFYRFFSQRLHEFNQVVVNHRPCFPFYASNGYAVFLPDIRFEVGRPGFAASKSLIPGVQKLVDMGIADPSALGIHGHSWSGYRTAFIITQTDMFAAAVAGAPVSNMTSAYGGIRWSSGRARQFQYEKTQSRIGGTLWEARDEYIDNSPLFFADRIQTPLLIQFGDEDGAVPWYQGIELYLAMRRLDKDCVFLQYRGEPHHLQKYPNKLDYSIKMKEYFDHYLKGDPAAKWITQGVPYGGK